MGTTYLYKLVPQTAFHFGLRGVGVEETEVTCPADTLFSALCITMREWEPDGSRALESWLARFPPLGSNGPPLRLSSAFPYAGEVLFFPKPRVPANLPTAIEEEKAKTLKKIEFVSEGIFRAWLAQEDLGGEMGKGHLLQGGRVWTTGAEMGKLEPFLHGAAHMRLWSKEMRPRVTVDRMTSHSSVYQAGVVRFAEGAGLYTLVEFLGGEVGAERDRLTSLLRVMGDGGLGGERSSGYGQFKVGDPERFDGFGALDGDLFLTLAPYHPTKAEVQAGVLREGSAYGLLTRRGWVGSPEGLNLRRREVRFIGEGSVLRSSGHGPARSAGDLADVTPQDEEGKAVLSHRVWRYGIAFPVPAADPVRGGEGA